MREVVQAHADQDDRQVRHPETRNARLPSPGFKSDVRRNIIAMLFSVLSYEVAGAEKN